MEDPPQVMTPEIQRVIPSPHQPPHADFDPNSLFMLTQHMQSTSSEKFSSLIDSGATVHCVGNEIEKYLFNVKIIPEKSFQLAANSMVIATKCRTFKFRTAQG